jgi:TrmH family RNA methyltransferase
MADPNNRVDRVSSPRNARVRAVARLSKGRERARRGLFVAEGVWGLRSARRAGVAPAEVWYCPEMLVPDAWDELSWARQSGADAIPAGRAAIERMSGREGPDGIVALFERLPTGLDRIALGPRPLVVVVESIEKPGNLGAIIRTASASGADGVVVCDRATDPFSPAAVKASLGTIFMIPVAVVGVSQALDWARRHRLRLFAATPGAERPHWGADYRGPTAIAVGNEHHGLSRRMLDASDERVLIPMPGPTDSLNATIAAGIILFEAVRQRCS